MKQKILNDWLWMLYKVNTLCVQIHNIYIWKKNNRPKNSGLPITSPEISKCTSSGHFTIPWSQGSGVVNGSEVTQLALTGHVTKSSTSRLHSDYTNYNYKELPFLKVQSTILIQCCTYILDFGGGVCPHQAHLHFQCKRTRWTTFPVASHLAVLSASCIYKLLCKVKRNSSIKSLCSSLFHCISHQNVFCVNGPQGCFLLVWLLKQRQKMP